MWPPGYPIFLSPFLLLFNYNVYWATSCFDIVVSVSLIYLLRKISLQIGFPNAAANLVTLIAGCFEYSFINESLPTDTIALDILLLGILIVLKNIDSPKLSFTKSLLTGFLLFLPCLFRYAYPPVAITIPVIIIMTGWLQKNKLLIKRGGLILTITILLIAAFFISLHNITGSSGYIPQTDRGYFIENIKHWYPVIPFSFISLPFFTSQIIKITGIKLQTLMLILEWINVILAIGFSVYFIWALFIKRLFLEVFSFKRFLLIGSIISIIICLTLGYLSFTYQIQKGYPNNWNYIYEARYFAFVFVFLQLVFIGWGFLFSFWKKNFFLRLIVGLGFFSLSVEVVHNLYFNTKVALNFKEYKAKVFREQDYNYFNSLIPLLEKEYAGFDLLVASRIDSYYPYTAAYMNKKGIFDCENLNIALPRVKRKSLLLVILYDNELTDFSRFLSNKNVKLLNRVLFSNFYSLELYP